MKFRCNICLTDNDVDECDLGREAPGCSRCGSNVRIRATMHLLSEALFGLSLPVPEFPVDMSVRGLGLSDWHGYASLLAEKFSYTNTYFHAEPFLDICNLPEQLSAGHDFLISAEVFEHVVPPVARAFRGARQLLNAGGVLILTVPWIPEGNETFEHFPGLHDFRVCQEDGRKRLYNTRADGTQEVFDDLIFHGGDGATLEMRLFTRTSLLRELRAAGFVDVRIAGEAHLEWGITWNDRPWSLPVLARAPI